MSPQPSVVMRDAVPAVVSQADFNQVQALRENRQRGDEPTSPRESDYILSSVLRCAGCGGPMVGHNGAGERKRYYRCVNGKEFRSCECGSIPKEEIEQAVLVAVRRDLSPEHLQAHLDRLEEQRRQEAMVQRAQLQAVLARVTELQRRQDRLDADYLEGRLEARQYGRLAERAEADLVSLTEQVGTVRQSLRAAEQTQFDVQMLWSLAQRIDSVRLKSELFDLYLFCGKW